MILARTKKHHLMRMKRNINNINCDLIIDVEDYTKFFWIQ